MTVLLDTYTFVWAVTAPDRLSSTAREVITDARTALLVSAATAWEMSIKHRSGRWPEVAVLIRHPFDRALAAQAMREGVCLISKDPAFAGLPGLAVVW